MKKRVLFVDDEILVLQGLERSLRPMRAEWEMKFTPSASQALEELHAAPFDVVVSDMMMPGTNGVQLLQQVRDLSPKTVRIVLSGHTEKELALEAVGVAHQFLSKPCDPSVLRTTLSRVTQFGFKDQNKMLMKLVGRLGRLPSPPAIYRQLEVMIDDPCSSVQEMGRLISQDMALTAHLLRIVNSAFFGLAQQVSQPSDAVAYLGFETLKAVVLAASLYDQCTGDPGNGFSLEEEAEHGQKVAAVARVIAETERLPRATVEECFTAGLLHDAGRLLLACNLPAQYKTCDLNSGLAGEIVAFGTTHAEIGGYLLGLWGLTSEVVDAARFHHAPAESLLKNFGILAIVHIANHLVHTLTPTGQVPPLDVEWLTSLGMKERLAIWYAAAENLLNPQSPSPSPVTI